jgi:predicted CoA-binding protein
MPSIAIVGASSNPEKWGNRAVRHYLELGWEVFPVNPREAEIEGLRAYPSVSAIGRAVDRVSLYLPPAKSLEALQDIADSGSREVFFNPGTESEAGIARARELGLVPIEACSIVAAPRRRG